MKNKIELKKYLRNISVAILVFIVITVIISLVQYRIYTNNFNNKIYSILATMKEKYPNITEEKILETLNSDETLQYNFLEEYGIDLNKDSIVQVNDNYLALFIIINISIIVLISFILEFLYLKHNYKKDQDIAEISSYIEQINKGNYKINIDNNTEDELSILKNEVYKTMIMLKEGAENSKKDKLSLKDSLSDISHQLKTPLTSIMIAIENLEDNPDLDIKTRDKFIKNIRRDSNNIRFLVESILKLSKLDTNAVTFVKKSTNVENIIKESLKNVENLCDLKNINIELEDSVNSEIVCDYHWQVEAITNVIKNAVEHADTLVKIKVEDNNIYCKITIINDGIGIDENDLKHIFEKFYKGKNASKDSIGIGLSLAKTIIKQDNGYIDANSKNNETTFIIKYLKR